MRDKVLITGGSGGIGAAAARACAARGAWPLIGYCAHRTAAEAVLADCGRGEVLGLDLACDDAGLAVAPGDVDYVVHCAGMLSPQRSLLETDEQEMRALFDVHLFGPLNLTRRLIAAGSPLKGVVFVLSSAAGCRGAGPYALSKAAALAGCKLLAGELAAREIQLAALVPGWTDTPMAAAAARQSGRSLDEIKSQHPDGRILSADEVGELCAQLLFDCPATPRGRLVVWDRRDAREPAELDFDQVFSLALPAEWLVTDRQG